MNPTLDDLRSRRDGILGQMQQIDYLRRGTLSQQFFKKRLEGKLVESGPYFVLQCFLKGKKCSERIPASQAAQVQQHVDNYRLFQELAQEFVSISDQITQREMVPAECKKNSRNLKSVRSSLKKPKPS